MKRMLLILLLIVASFATGMAAAWYFRLPAIDPVNNTSRNQPLLPERVIAQGKLQPRGGILNVYGPTGLRVSELLVREGDRVEANQTELCHLTGQAALAKQVELADARISDAVLELQHKKLLAETNLRAAELQVKSAEINLSQAAQQGNLDIERRRISLAESKLQGLRKLAEDPDTQNLVSSHAIEEQEVALDEARRKLSQTELALTHTNESLQLALRIAEQNRDSARQVAASTAKSLESNRTANLTRQLAELQASEARLLAPLTGTVLKIFLRKGEAIVNSPILQLGDLTGIECLAEVNESLVSRIHEGQRVVLRDQALPQALRGTVRAVGNLVGTPSYRDPNPLAMVDRRAVEVLIDLDAADIETARHLLNLQVTVEIDTNGNSTDPPTSVVPGQAP